MASNLCHHICAQQENKDSATNGDVNMADSAGDGAVGKSSWLHPLIILCKRTVFYFLAFQVDSILAIVCSFSF